MQDFRNVSVEALGQLLTITKALATFSTPDEIAESKRAAQAYARTVGPKGSLQEASSLIAIARQQQNQQRQTTQGAKEIIADAREQLALTEGQRFDRMNADRLAAQEAIQTNEEILRREIENEAAIQAKKYSEQINGHSPSARSNVGQSDDQKAIQDGVLSWVKRQRRRGIKM